MCGGPRAPVDESKGPQQGVVRLGDLDIDQPMPGSQHKAENVSLTRTLSGRKLYIVSSQVGGSLPMLKDSEGHICKPAAIAEKEFYETLPKVYPFLVPFTPAYYGCCKVNIKNVLRDVSKHLEMHHGHHTKRVYADGRVSLDTPLPVKERWAIFQDRRYKKIKQDAEGNVAFIMLEDVTRDHQFSNVLDVKLGSAQYANQQQQQQLATTTGELPRSDQSPRDDSKTTKAIIVPVEDEAQRQKLERAARKCAQSTSSRFGFRINGMQIYREDKKLYKIVDKYDCRQLDIDGADRVLERFLKYPTWENLGQIRGLIQDLTALAAALRRTSWRFWGLSLLLSYDPSQIQPPSPEQAGAHENRRSSRVDVRLIDFAKCERCATTPSSTAHPHESVVRGVENLTKLLKNIEQRHVALRDKLRKAQHQRRTRTWLSAGLMVAAMAGGLFMRAVKNPHAGLN